MPITNDNSHQMEASSLLPRQLYWGGTHISSNTINPSGGDGDALGARVRLLLPGLADPSVHCDTAASIITGQVKNRSAFL